MDIINTDDHCDVAEVFQDNHQTADNLPKDGREMPDHIPEFISHVEQTRDHSR